MNLTDLDHFTLLSQLPVAEKVVFASRCAGVAVRLLNSMSLPVGIKEMTALETTVRDLEEWTSQGGDLARLQSSMQKLRHLAFTLPSQFKYRTDSVICHVVHAAYAAGMTAFTSSNVHAEEALKSAFAAARTAESTVAEDSLWEELRRVRRVASEAGELRRNVARGTVQTNGTLP
jgi:hypothetical protein